jgi:methyl-accepting chemotaxis protein
MRMLGERSSEVFEIVDMIEEIAARSELLSMNAAIEAAHAGDAGRGFGVVADEIRVLSERSTEATKQVTKIVKGMAMETQAALAAMENSTAEVKHGIELSARARHASGEISALMQQATHLSEQISAAAREQSLATRTVADAMQAISNITEQSAAGVNESSRAVQDLVRLSEQLTQAISRFRIEDPKALVGKADESAKTMSTFLGEMDALLRRRERRPPAAAPDDSPSAEREPEDLVAAMRRMIARFRLRGAGQD